MIETIQGPDHPDIVVGLNNLASLIFHKERSTRGQGAALEGALPWEGGLLETRTPYYLNLLTLGLSRTAQKEFDQKPEHLLFRDCKSGKPFPG